ncbi:FHA domain-containing protein [Phormidium tenue FACHB-886]|nr:FHA domain-containing protein [Phormidium tenue FACHB-886]
MANLNSLSVSALHLQVVREQSPLLSESLLADCNYEIDAVASVIEPLLLAPKRCRYTSLYLQAIATERTAFLATNLVLEQTANLTPIASSWLIGRSPSCAISIRHKTVSRCHAMINQHPIKGLSITDVGSSNGTWVNRHRLQPLEKRWLKDGDVLQFGKLTVEFFLADRRAAWAALGDSTRPQCLL